MSTKDTGSSTAGPPKTEANAAGAAEKPGGSTGFREPGMKRMETTTLFRVTNFELFVKPASEVYRLLFDRAGVMIKTM